VHLSYAFISYSDKASLVKSEEEYNTRNKRHFSFEKNYHKQNSNNEEFRYQGTVLILRESHHVPVDSIHFLFHFLITTVSFNSQ